MKNIIIITGAGKGIGRSIALDFAKEAGKHNNFNPVLILISRTLSDLEPLSSECGRLGAETEIFQADIADTAKIGNIVDTTFRRYGQIDCLVNNAGVGRFGPLAELTEDDYEYTMSVNLKGTFFLTQKVFPVMEKQHSGHIFFITSVAARTAFKSSALYCMSKFGQKGLVEVMRLHARSCNVRITEVMPGAVFTPMWGEVPEEMKKVMMMPEDISGPLVGAYLLPGRTTVEELVFRPVGGDIND